MSKKSALDCEQEEGILKPRSCQSMIQPAAAGTVDPMYLPYCENRLEYMHDIGAVLK